MRARVALPRRAALHAAEGAPASLPPSPHGPDTFVLPIARWPAFTVSLAAFFGYLFATHSFKFPIATEMMVLAMFGLLIEPGKVRMPPGFYWCAAFLGWAAITIALADHTRMDWPGWQEYVKVLLILIVATNIGKTPMQTSAFLVAWLACFALWPVRGTLFNFAAGINIGGRYAWNFIYRNPNDLAAITLLILGLALVAARSRNARWLQWCSGIGVGILTLMVFLTQSRGGFLGLAVFALIAVSTHRKRGQAVLGLGVLGALVFALAPASVWERLGGLKAATSTQTLAEVDPEGSAESRFKIWKVAFRMTAENPITGVGFGAAPKVHRVIVAGDPELRDTRSVRGERDTHSTYFNVLAETGFVGLALFLGFIITFGLFLVRSWKRLAETSAKRAEQFKYLFASWCGFWTASVFATNHRVVTVYVFVGFATCLAAAYGVFGDGAAKETSAAPALGPRGRTGVSLVRRTP